MGLKIVRRYIMPKINSTVMSVAEFRRNQKELRERDLVRQAVRLRSQSGKESLRSAFDMDDFVLDMTIRGVKNSHPNIGESKLLEEVKRIYQVWRTCERSKR